MKQYQFFKDINYPSQIHFDVPFVPKIDKTVRTTTWKTHLSSPECLRAS